MKKTKYFFLLMLILAFLNLPRLKADAKVLEKPVASSCNSLDSFNVFGGWECISNRDLDDYDRINWFLGRYIETGMLTNEIYGKIGDEEAIIKEELTFNDGILSYYEYYFNGKLFYEAEPDTDETLVYTDEEIDIPLLYGKDDAIFTVTKRLYDTKGLYQYEFDGVEENLTNYAFFFTEALTYTVNKTYSDSDVHIVTDYVKPYSMEEILSMIQVSDNGQVSDVWVDNNTYDPKNVEEGETYHFRYFASDLRGNISSQIFYVEAKDILAPEIHLTAAPEVLYNHQLSEEELKDYFTVSDNAGEQNVTVSFDIDSYLAAWNKRGTYSCRAYVKDLAGNTSGISFEIKVYDDVAPYFITPAEINTGTDSKLDLGEIKSHIHAMDECDGKVDELMEIEDTLNYEENWQTPGDYYLSLTAEDYTGNPVTGHFVIHVLDTTAPTITIDKYAIFTKKGEKITKEQVIVLFKALGYDVGEDEVESDAFFDDSLDGEYSVEVNNDDVTEEVIITSDDTAIISYEIPQEKEKKNHIPLIIALSVLGAALVSGGIFGFVLYKKKH